ncbi:tRNA wybutosine-synthesizing protein 4-like [Anneissia japonica]|uniref:tRNA wybutosine-synthesizing protein 4-like n=1 Tax=Anneissia japonica TaxID=1529436 RepID=UPI0014256E44|nr:tRNA wybutosine-synthesizing protein 4-like [Anneissia japonica]XP_033111076.1 tRNA wybutosine-synthesizing protein 4-like [Anneissia japonica]XP_033111077.1 tRNA wybutosine-synthesizing protein 4-like [Anneissia japonica]
MPQDIQKTSKSRSDTAVQGTNDSSIVSKCSMVTRGYFHDDFVCHFVAKQSRRSSLINKGYYIRAKAVDHIFKYFFAWCNGTENQVISLGAGFDSAFFRLKSEGLLETTRFVEVDFPDVVRRKVALIQHHHQLNQVLKDELKIPDTIHKLKDVCPVYSSPGYHIIGCDLKQVAKLTSCLMHCGIDYQLPTLVLSECVITYMGSKSSNPVIQWVAETFPDAMFASYEQIYPYDAFGKVMCGHFKRIGSPLKSIEKFPTPKHQVKRYCELGWASCVCIDMNELYCNILPQDETRRAADLELFDEYEEFHCKCSHYMICCAFNGTCQELKPQIKQVKDEKCKEEKEENTDKDVHSIPCSAYQCNPGGNIQRYGHCSSQLGSTKIVLTGGFGVTSGGHTKISQVEIIDTDSENIIEVKSQDADAFVPRMHHTMTRLADNQLLVFGGRMSPAKPLNDSCLLNFEIDEHGVTYTCQRLQCTVEPQPRWRQSATIVDRGGHQQVVVYGGRSTNEVFGDLWLMDVESKQWSEVALVQPGPTPRHSHSCCTWGSNVILTGGLDDDANTIDGVIIMDTADWSWHTLKTSPDIQPRYSHTSHVVKDLLLLVGGLSLSPVTFGVTSISLLSGSVCNYSLMAENPEKPIMLFKISSELYEEERKLVILGGGGNCFSFGTHFNSTPISLDISKVGADHES